MSSNKPLIVENILLRVKEYLAVSSDGELAKRLNLGQTAISAWKKRGKVNLDLIITECAGADLNWLLYGEGEMRMTPEAQDKLEVVDIDVGPGDLMMRLMPVYDEAGQLDYYVRVTYLGLTKEEGEEQRRRGGQL